MHISNKVGNWALCGMAVVLLLLSSCVPMKKQIYLQTNNADSIEVYQNENPQTYTLQPGNNVYVKVVSINSETSDFFNFGTGSSGNVFNDAAIYLSSYSINEEGNVELPFIGELYVKDLTLEEAKTIVQKEIDQYLTNTMVILKLVNFNVTIVGEVQVPGQYKIYQDRVNIFKVLSIAGDLTPFAKRNDVVLVRKMENGSKIHHINLLEDNILESEYFYIMPDDIIYVQPVKGKNFAFKQFPYTLVISSISLVIALFALFK